MDIVTYLDYRSKINTQSKRLPKKSKRLPKKRKERNYEHEIIL